MAAIPRRPRRHPALKKYGPLFSKFMHGGNYEMAGKVAFATVLEMDGISIFVAAMDAANSYIRRLPMRRGL